MAPWPGAHAAHYTARPDGKQLADHARLDARGIASDACRVAAIQVCGEAVPVSLVIAIASSSVSKRNGGATGPNVSAPTICIAGQQLVIKAKAETC
jgi:hypothetical protein